MATCLVTGGAGFIGSHIVDALVARGDSVRVFDNFSTGRRENLAQHGTAVEIVEGDLRDADAVRAAAEGIEVVFHEGALPSVPRSVKDPVTSNAVNVTGTVNVLLAARDAGVRRVMYASSSSLYGNVDVSPKHEGLVPAPASPYAVSKLTGEYYCQAFTRVYGLETVSLRYFNVFGPRQDPKSPYAAVIPIFVSQMRTGRRPTVHGDGTQSRDFTYVSNVVHANLLAAEAPDAAGLAMNAACGDSITLLELVAKLNQLLGTDLAPEFGPPREGDVKHSRADISRASTALGYAPVATFDEGLAATVAHLCAST
jgi:UDP-glucose 4-epimerase